jgi:hypothetical protein
MVTPSSRIGRLSSRPRITKAAYKLGVRRERIDLIRIDVPDVRRGTNSEWLHSRHADEVARIASAARGVLSHVR